MPIINAFPEGGGGGTKFPNDIPNILFIKGGGHRSTSSSSNYVGGIYLTANDNDIVLGITGNSTSNSSYGVVEAVFVVLKSLKISNVTFTPQKYYCLYGTPKFTYASGTTKTSFSSYKIYEGTSASGTPLYTGSTSNNRISFTEP